MKRATWLVTVLAVGMVFCADGAFAKGNKNKGGKKGKNSVPTTVIGAMTITGTVKADGDNVKVIAEDKTEYTLDISLALANKDKNDQKVTITGNVTETAGKKWLSEVSKEDKADDKPIEIIEKKAKK